MAYTIPLDQPLSETQAKLLAQVGSMKNLADLSFLKKFKDKFKKEEGMSIFDYLMKILKSMGIDPELILTAFLNELFKTEKLVELILRAMAQLATVAKVKLDSTVTFQMPTGNMSVDEKKKLTDINYTWLNSGLIKEAVTLAVAAIKTKLIQELMVLIFGKPKSPDSATGPNGLVSDDVRLGELVDEAVCGGASIFSISSPSNVRNEDLEYNRLQKLEQVKNGNLTFKVTCQGVDISLPDNPMYLFRDAPPGFVESKELSPQEALSNVFDCVGKQIQKKTSGDTSQSNSKTGSKSFVRKLLDTLISSISALLKPLLFGGAILPIPGLPNGVMGAISDTLGYVPTDGTGEPFDSNTYAPPISCEVVKMDKNNLTTTQKKKTAIILILCNLLLNIAIGFIMAYVLEKVKKLITKYIVKRAQEKIKRKLKKIQETYSLKYGGKQKRKIEKSAKQARLLKVVQPALKAASNVAMTNLQIP